MSLPNMPTAALPHKDDDGNFDGSAHCESRFPETRPPVPLNSQPDDMPTDLFEQGYKECLGALTEGRFLAFATTSTSSNRRLLAHSLPDRQTLDSLTSIQEKDKDEDEDFSSPHARWILHYYNDNSTSSTAINTTATSQDPPYLLSSHDRRVWLGANAALVPRADAVPVDIEFVGGGRDQNRGGEIMDRQRGYYVRYYEDDEQNKKKKKKYLVIEDDGKVRFDEEGRTKMRVVSVSYHK